MNEKEKFRALIQKRKDHNLAIGNPLFTVMAEEIIINLKRVEQDYHINLTMEMEWLRNKVKKGE
jgi:hypothetical protein